MDNKKYENNRIIQLEANLLEQEHRPFHLISNYLNRKKKWSDLNDPRRKSVQRALIWRLFFSPTVLAIGGSSFIALITVFLMKNQNNIISKQNELIREQNRRIQIQANLEEAQRRNNLVLLMDNILVQVGNELKENKDSILSRTLVSRIQALGQGFLPYRFLDYSLKSKSNIDSLGLTKELSPERGQLLLSLVNSGISEESMDDIYWYTSFDRSYLRDSYFSGGYLNGIILTNSDMKNVTITSANLSDGNLSGSDLRGADLTDSDLSGVDFINADLRNATLKGSDLSYADLRGAKLDNAILHDTNLQNTTVEQDWFSIMENKITPALIHNIRTNYEIKEFGVFRDTGKKAFGLFKKKVISKKQQIEHISTTNRVTSNMKIIINDTIP